MSSVNRNIPGWVGEQRTPGSISGGGTGADGVDGDPGLVWRGTWSALTSYVPNDAVYRGGTSYICLNDNSNVAPPNAAYWDVLATTRIADYGKVTLGAGVATVAAPSVTANSLILLTRQETGANPGWPRVSARTAGVGFDVVSSNGADTGDVAWTIVEP